MKSNIKLLEESSMSLQYLKRRNFLINMIKNLNHKLNFRSQTYFLAVYYMDIIFNNVTRVSKQINEENFELYAVGCLLIAAKFDENDPNIPDLYQFQTLSSNGAKFKFYFTIEEIRRTEVICIAALDYKLNYFTVYHFLIYFFTHGIVFKEEEDNNNKSNKSSKVNKANLIEKIYSFARELLDIIIENCESLIYLSNISIACGIIAFARISVLSNENVCLHKELFELIYEEEWETYEESFEIIKSMYEVSKKANLNVNSFDYEQKNRNNIPLPMQVTIPMPLREKILNDYIRHTKQRINSVSEEIKPRASSSQKENISKVEHNRQLSSRELELVTIKKLKNDQIESSKIIKSLNSYKEGIYKKNFQIKNKIIYSSNQHIESDQIKKENTHFHSHGKDTRGNNNITALKKNEIKELEENSNEDIRRVKNIQKRNLTGEHRKDKVTSSPSSLIKDIENNFKKLKMINLIDNNTVQNDNFNLVQKTKKIFSGNNLCSALNTNTNTDFDKNINNIKFQNNLKKKKTFLEINEVDKIESPCNDNPSPSTIIINNNININTYINKDSIPSYSKYSLIRHDDKYNNYNIDKYSYKNNSNNNNDYDKNNIRKKIDFEISNRKSDKSICYSSNGVNYDHFYNEFNEYSGNGGNRNEGKYTYSRQNDFTSSNSNSNSNTNSIRKFEKNSHFVKRNEETRAVYIDSAKNLNSMKNELNYDYSNGQGLNSLY